jgi:uncharacterized protein YecE (DUF72 family)
VATGAATLERLSVGTSGWSYPSWRPGFYPAGTDPSDFLAYYARHFATVELNTTGYRLPAEDQFRRWAEQVPDGFEFAPKLPGGGWERRRQSRRSAAGKSRTPAASALRLRELDVFAERVLAFGDRLGPVRVSLKSARDEGVLELLLGSLDPALRLAFDLEHPSWDGIEERLADAGAVRVNDLDHPAPFRYLRRRTPPDEALAERVRAAGGHVYVYFRHADEPTAPAYAEQLAGLVGFGR